MKKLVLFFATALVAVSFSACGPKAENTENTEATPVVEQVIQPAVDSAAVVDTTATPVK